MTSNRSHPPRPSLSTPGSPEYRTFLDRLTGHRAFLLASLLSVLFGLAITGMFVFSQIDSGEFYLGIAAVGGFISGVLGFTTSADALRDIARKPKAPDINSPGADVFAPDATIRS